MAGVEPNMKATRLMVVFAGMFLGTLVWGPEPAPTGVFAQGAGAPAAGAPQGRGLPDGGRQAQPPGVPGGAGAPGGGRRGRGAPVIQGPPAGVTPLATDLFSSKNFYKDKA